MKFGDIVMHFNILDAIKFLAEDDSVFRINIMDDVVDEYSIEFYS